MTHTTARGQRTPKRGQWIASYLEGNGTLTLESAGARYPYRAVFTVNEEAAVAQRDIEYLRPTPIGMMDRTIDDLRRRVQLGRGRGPIHTFSRTVIIRRAYHSAIGFLEHCYPDPRQDRRGFVQDLARYLATHLTPHARPDDPGLQRWVQSFAPAVEKPWWSAAVITPGRSALQWRC